MFKPYKLVIAAVAVIGTLAVIAPVSYAEIIKFTVRPGNFTFGTPPTLIPLDSAGRKAMRYILNARGTAVLTYSAECAVNAPGGNTSAWLDIDIIVNGTAVAPTAGSSDAFCSANGTAGSDGWAMQSITVVIPLKAGTNTVSIQGRLNNGAVSGWIGDSSLVITK